MVTRNASNVTAAIGPQTATLRTGGLVGAPLFPLELFIFVANKLLLAEHAVNNRDEKERGERSENQTANDSAAERRVLLAAFAKTKRERQHADDHCKRSH